VELRFLQPDVRRLDETSVEACVCAIWSDERPMRGLAGLLDWRFGGRLSALLKSGFVRGDLGEVLLVPGKPHVPFEKVLVVGLGSRQTFADEPFRQAMTRIASTLEGMRIGRAIIELPGRSTGAIDPERAVALMFECAGASREHETWWLVEDASTEKRLEASVWSRRFAAR
jgi:hypothetical protein